MFAYDIGDGTAQAISYQQAVYFGSGNLTGQIVTFYERFNDVWRKDLADGSLKISKKSLAIFVSSPFPRVFVGCSEELFPPSHGSFLYQSEE